MAQKMDKDIYAVVNSFYSPDKIPEGFEKHLVTETTPIVRYIAAKGQDSLHLVVEVAAVEHGALKLLGLSFRYAATELEALIKDTLDQDPSGGKAIDEKMRKNIEARLSDLDAMLKLEPRKCQVLAWFAPGTNKGIDFKPNKSVAGAYGVNTDKAIGEVQEVNGDRPLSGDADDANSSVDEGYGDNEHSCLWSILAQEEYDCDDDDDHDSYYVDDDDNAEQEEGWSEAAWI